ARADRGGRAPAPPPAVPRGRRDPRGAVRQPLPLHRLRPDPGGRQERRECELATLCCKVARSARPRALELRRVGATVLRSDGVPKTTGEFAYSSDLSAPGMLWGHTLRSPHAHARVVALDVSGALGMPGVHAVLTHADVPGQKTYGLEFPDQPG